MTSKKQALVAGGFGFLGQYIVWGLIRRGYQVTVGTSRRKDLSIQDRFRRFAHFNRRVNPAFRLHEHELKSVDIVECDIGKNYLALSQQDYLGLVQTNFSQVWNCAAYMKYDAATYEKSYETNVIGTLNLLRLASLQPECTYYHVSTAYVGGKDFCDGSVLREQIYPSKNGYFNSYDRTKAYAEKEIAAYCQAPRSLPYAIFRPSIIIGDSQTGFTSCVSGFYEYLQALNRLKKHIKGKTVHYVCNEQSSLYLLPVDRCAQAMLALMPLVSLKTTPIYNIVDVQPMTLGKMASILENLFDCQFVCSPNPPQGEQDCEKLLRLFTKRNQIFSQQVFEFCAAQTNSLIGASICSDWSKDHDFFGLINERFNEFRQLSVSDLS